MRRFTPFVPVLLGTSLLGLALVAPAHAAAMDVRAVCAATESTSTCLRGAEIVRSSATPFTIRHTGKSARQTSHHTTRHAATHRPTTAADATPLHLPAYTPAGSQSLPRTDSVSLVSLIVKFAVVMGLLLLTLRVLKMILPRLQGGGRVRPGAMVLHSETIGPKERIVILDLGTRLVVAGSTGSAMSGLATIDNPDEMATLRTRYGAPQPAPAAETAVQMAAPVAQSFAAVLSRAMNRPAHTGTAAQEVPPAPEQGRDLIVAETPVKEMPSPRPPGDATLNHALQTLRSLRQQMQDTPHS